MGKGNLPGFVFHEPFGYLDYNKLQLDSKCVISDSGTISEESALAGFPAITLRESIERPEAVEVGSITLCPIGDLQICNQIRAVLDKVGRPPQTPQGYEVSDFSDRVMSFVLSSALSANVVKGVRTA
jgi:UDP-N-acetylglucosamine 2-epimerase (non-hydrolysing)